MNKLKLTKFGTGAFAIFFIVLAMVALCGFSWAIVCGVVKLITLCFGWHFSWAIGTGVWLALVLFASIVNK